MKTKRAKKLTKAQDCALAMEEGLLALGAVKGIEDGTGWVIFSLPTKVGILRVLAVDQLARSSKVLSVFTKFDSPDFAETKTDCNPYNGKWNHHMFADDYETGRDFAEYVLKKIKELL